MSSSLTVGKRLTEPEFIEEDFADSSACDEEIDTKFIEQQS